MATEIEIASNALLLLGDDAITSLTDDPVVNGIFEETYKSVLMTYPWSFALADETLTPSTEPFDETGYSKAFAMDSETLRVWAVFPIQNYRIVGYRLYTNASAATVRHVRRVDTSLLPATVQKALEYKLASDFAMSITEDINKANFYEQKYLDALAMAQTIDAQQHPPEPIMRNPLSRKRRWRR